MLEGIRGVDNSPTLHDTRKRISQFGVTGIRESSNEVTSRNMAPPCAGGMDRPVFRLEKTTARGGGGFGRAGRVNQLAVA